MNESNDVQDKLTWPDAETNAHSAESDDGDGGCLPNPCPLVPDHHIDTNVVIALSQKTGLTAAMKVILCNGRQAKIRIEVRTRVRIRVGTGILDTCDKKTGSISLSSRATSRFVSYPTPAEVSRREDNPLRLQNERQRPATVLERPPS